MKHPFDQQTTMPRFILGVFAFIFGGVGVTVLVFLWGTPHNQFGSPPLFFRFFGSFIALGFIAFAVGMIYSALNGQFTAMPPSFSGHPRHEHTITPPQESPGTAYACPRCGAPLSKNADVSPMGDVKCDHCAGWFNIHGRHK